MFDPFHRRMRCGDFSIECTKYPSTLSCHLLCIGELRILPAFKLNIQLNGINRPSYTVLSRWVKKKNQARIQSECEIYHSTSLLTICINNSVIVHCKLSGKNQHGKYIPKSDEHRIISVAVAKIVGKLNCCWPKIPRCWLQKIHSPIQVNSNFHNIRFSSNYKWSNSNITSNFCLFHIRIPMQPV